MEWKLQSQINQEIRIFKKKNFFKGVLECSLLPEFAQKMNKLFNVHLGKLIKLFVLVLFKTITQYENIIR